MKHKKLPLGFTFSFPVRHEDIDKVSRWRREEMNGWKHLGRTLPRLPSVAAPQPMPSGDCNCDPCHFLSVKLWQIDINQLILTVWQSLSGDMLWSPQYR
jgi:hypothetical protein